MVKFTGLIPQNIAFENTETIGVYSPRRKLVGTIPLHGLSHPNKGSKLYSFGALSDVHIGESTSENDFKTALSYLSKTTDFICICGDLIHGSAENAPGQTVVYRECVENSATVPVYACAGNHDAAYVENIETAITTYTGQPIYYSITQGDDVFIFVGNVTSAGGWLFTKAELQWLYETLETNRNKRCFVFQHVRPDDTCGNALGIYTHDIWGSTEATVFESLMHHYKNAHFFHGHSHLKFYLQNYDETANISRNFGGWSIHIPSISVPRDTTSLVDPSIRTIYADSEGYVVDVYENGIHLRGRDFIKGEFLPIASYWLDTTLQTIEAKTYTDSTKTIIT